MKKALQIIQNEMRNNKDYSCKICFSKNNTLPIIEIVRIDKDYILVNNNNYQYSLVNINKITHIEIVNKKLIDKISNVMPDLVAFS